MPLVKKQAVEIRQGDQPMFLTAFTVKEFTAPRFYTVKDLIAEPDTGYQRILEEKRARRLAADMIAAHKHEQPQALLPTSILLATELPLNYSSARREISFDSDLGPERDYMFAVVDGQHRIEGMRRAAEIDSSLSDFPLAVIVAQLGRLEQMLQFYLVNTTQKSVDQGITQQIQARLTEKYEIGTDVFLPARLEGVVRRRTVGAALKIAQFLNNNEESPWFDRMSVAGTEGGKRRERGKIPQRTFVQSVQRNLLVKGHWLARDKMDSELRNKLLRNYWRAVEDIFTDAETPPEKSVAFQSNGVVFFHTVSMPLFVWLSDAKHRDFRVEKIKRCFKSAFDHLPVDHDMLRRPHWWASGGEASGINKGEIKKRAGAMMQAIKKARSAELGEDRM